MKRVLHEREVILKNQEYDTSQLVYKMLHHLREIKKLKIELSHIEKKKKKQVKREVDIIQVYHKRYEQID